VEVVQPGLDALLTSKVNGTADVDRIAHFLARNPRGDLTASFVAHSPGEERIACELSRCDKKMFLLRSWF
jgi:hypothetical protein